MKAANVPQFIVLTVDDPITPYTMKQVLSITTENYNRNGCGVPATWFLNAGSTNASLAQQAFVQGHEIAIQSMYGEAQPTATDIIMAKEYLNQTALLPIDKIRGFRAPYLISEPAQRAALANNGFRFDASIVAGPDSSSKYVWPYTLDHGVAQTCSTGSCSISESYAGLWEFPAWTTADASGTQAGPIDVATSGLSNIYANALTARYNGNRAPLRIYLHAATLMANPSMVDDLNTFLTWALNQQNTWVVTMSQVLDWMQNPESVDTYNAECPSVADQLAQLPADIEVCILPNTGCNYGTWNPNTCSCDCQSENSVNQGYCKDATGSCTVVKPFNFTANEYMCSAISVSSPPPPPADSPASGPAAAVTPNLVLNEAQCGHSLLNFTGLAISGYSDAAVGYSNAIKALDGSCTTCGLAPIQGGVSYFTIELPSSVKISGVSIVSSWDVLISISVGESIANGGIGGASCATKYQLTAGKAVVVPCAAKGSVIRVSTDGTLTLCDIYPIITSNTASPSPAPDTNMTSMPVSMTVLAVTTDVAEKTTGPTICKSILTMLDEPEASCAVLSVTTVSGSRRLLTDGVQINMNVTTAQPELLQSIMDQPSSVAASLIDVEAIPVSADSITYNDAFYSPPPPGVSPSPTDVVPSPPANSGSSGKKSNVAGIVGGVIGGLLGGALVIFGIVMLMRWRRRRAAEGTTTGAADEKPGEGPKQQVKPVKAPKGRGPSINQGRKGPAVNNRPKKNADATATLGLATDPKAEDKADNA